MSQYQQVTFYYSQKRLTIWLYKRPTKETYKRDLQKRQTTVKDAPTLASCHNTNESRSIIREKRLTIWLYKRPTKGTCTRDLQKRPTKDTYKRDLQKRQICAHVSKRTHTRIMSQYQRVTLYYSQKRLTIFHYTRDLQKRPTKETCKRDLQKRP